MESIRPTPEQAQLIRSAFQLPDTEEVPELYPVEGGLTNHSFRFTCRNREYILREPGSDTGEFIDRNHEAAVYAAIADPALTDDVVVLDPASGRKISRFWPSARTCDPTDENDVRQCMALLRKLHSRKLHVDHRYDFFRMNQVFIRLMPETSSRPDHDAVQKRCLDMVPYLARYQENAILAHCDTVPANFLFVDGDSGPELHLIDWEYAGAHDPCIDIAMFANDGNYSPEQVDWLIRCYLDGEEPTPELRMRVYGYLALTGMMFCNWEEYVRAIGLHFEEYGQEQFRHASVFSALFWDLLPTVWTEEEHVQS